MKKRASPRLFLAPVFRAIDAPPCFSSLISLQGNKLIISTELSVEQSSTTITSKGWCLAENNALRQVSIKALPLWFGMITDSLVLIGVL